MTAYFYVATQQENGGNHHADGNIEFSGRQQRLMAENSVRLSPVFSLEKEMDGYTLLRGAIGAQGELCILLGEDIPTPDYNIFTKEWSGNLTRGYRGIIWDGGRKEIYDFPDQDWQVAFFEPIDQGENLLLCSARSRNNGNGDIEQNAKVYTRDGQLVREFCLGDGIGNLSVTDDNHIWCGYFDEGIFGNNGWEIPLGRSGLVKWNSEGRKVWEHQEPEGLFLFDCSSFTVDGGRVSFSYHTGYDIGITENGETSHFSLKEMSSAMALYGNRISLFEGNRILHTKLIGKSYDRCGATKLQKQNGDTLNPGLLATRGSQFFMLVDHDLYLYDTCDS